MAHLASTGQNHCAEVLEGVADAEPLYRLVTTILDEAQAPAADLAALYHERWEIEGVLQTHTERSSR